MRASSQLHLAGVCPRCGAELVDEAEFDRRLGRALEEIDRARQRWPVGVTEDLRAFKRALRCRFGTCEGGRCP